MEKINIYIKKQKNYYKITKKQLNFNTNKLTMNIYI